jgi:hypothetical protein
VVKQHEKARQKDSKGNAPDLLLVLPFGALLLALDVAQAAPAMQG